MAKALLKLGLTQDLVNRDLIRSILDTDDNGMPHNEYVSFWESLAKLEDHLESEDKSEYLVS